MRIFRTQIDVALIGAGAQRGDRHALDQHERIALHDHAIGEGAGVALVGVADDILLVRRGLHRRAQLDPAGKARAPAPAQTGFHHLIGDLRAIKRRCVPQTFVSAVREVIVERDWIDHAHAREGQSLLILEIGNLLGESQAKFVGAALQKTGVEELRHRVGAHRTVSDAATRGRHLDHRLQPVKSA